MAVHLPLSIEAQVEAHTLMMSTHNIFSPSNGAPIISPSQDIVMGCYYLTMGVPESKGDGMVFSSMDEVATAYAAGKVGTHARIKVRLPKDRNMRDEYEKKTGFGKRVEANNSTPEAEMQHMMDHGHMSEWMQEVRRSKALASILSQVTFVDADGNTVELTAPVTAE